MDLDGTDLSDTAIHRIGSLGMDLGPATGNLWLYHDLTSAGAGVLRGPGGVDLLLVTGGIGNGVSSSRGYGAGGALLGAGGEPRADLTVKPAVNACIGWSEAASSCAVTGSAATVRAGTLTLGASVDVAANVYSDIQAGSLVVQIGVAKAKGVLDSAAYASISPDSVVIVGGNATLTATDKSSLVVRAIAKGGSGVANNNAMAAGVITVNAQVRIGRGRGSRSAGS